ncbi:MAG: hypothetical protein QN141_06895 [Armatimonadota bacterium]|nr:hypothetical protein [Armatimonadota bacterium]MDR7450417.1 hypothetical protein [Armatimonadota bacterium]MDR7467000.1 hypothetical protein [Armatimonadota bacterium]MDR7493458.1 hypothetical protein [Armatimonadota bacterium]MDR7498723.1 hypothetical protein [Armatimonadota bacterium]
MRFAVVLAAALLLLVPVRPVAAQQPPPQQPPAAQEQAPPPQLPAPPRPEGPAGPRNIVPGRSLAGVAIGARLSNVLTRFGRPSAIRETALDTAYLFSRYGITVYARSGAVTAVASTNSLLKIDETLGVGYRVESVYEVFGRDFRRGTVEGFPGLIYEGRGIAFGLDGQGVAAILVFRPGTSAMVSALQRGAPAAIPTATGYPNVAHLRGYTAETRFMSLAGYLRRLVYETSGIWITAEEAERVVREQLSASH